MGNLKAQYSGPESILTWTAPYSLAGIDTYYQVSLADESTGVGSPVITIYGTSYKFNTTDLVACRTYLFSIQAWNDAGGGNITILKKFFPGGILIILPSCCIFMRKTVFKYIVIITIVHSLLDRRIVV